MEHNWTAYNLRKWFHSFKPVFIKLFLINLTFKTKFPLAIFFRFVGWGLVSSTRMLTTLRTHACIETQLGVFVQVERRRNEYAVVTLWPEALSPPLYAQLHLSIAALTCLAQREVLVVLSEQRVEAEGRAGAVGGGAAVARRVLHDGPAYENVTTVKIYELNWLMLRRNFQIKKRHTIYLCSSMNAYSSFKVHTVGLGMCSFAHTDLVKHLLKSLTLFDL